MSLIERWLGKPEVIGDPACPILYRWTLVGGHKPGEAREVSGEPKPEQRFKVFLHHFLPRSADRDPHDHPRPFVTLVLRGAYTDYAGVRGEPDKMTPGKIRYRPALHTHRTITGERGCWTLVLVGPLKREWGFHKDGAWWPWELYHKTFGHGMRCE